LLHGDPASSVPSAVFSDGVTRENEPIESAGGYRPSVSPAKPQKFVILFETILYYMQGVLFFSC
jgi:hypothetical protein